MASVLQTAANKSDDAMRTIGEAATELGIKPHILRYWEAQFPVLQPLKRAGGRRYYRSADMALLREIDRLLNREGFTIKGARHHLKSRRAPRTETTAIPGNGGGLPTHVLHSQQAAALGLSPMVEEELRAIRAVLQSALDNS